MNTKREKRDVWTHCERGHLFYQANSTTRCHVCKAHRLPSLAQQAERDEINRCPFALHNQTPEMGLKVAENRLACMRQQEHDPKCASCSYDLAMQSWEDVIDAGRQRAQKQTDSEANLLEKISHVVDELARRSGEQPPDAAVISPAMSIWVNGVGARLAAPPVELHEAHIVARRKWRKALADMLREERASRTGQTSFRIAVLANYGGRCAITGTVSDVEAAHIEPWRENGNQEADNGIPMVWALHKCYDRIPAMFAIHPDTLRIHVRPDVVGLEGIDGKQIADGQRHRLNRDALRARWAAFVLYKVTSYV